MFSSKLILGLSLTLASAQAFSLNPSVITAKGLNLKPAAAQRLSASAPQLFSPRHAARLAPRPLSSLSMMAGDNKKVIVLGGDGFCGWPTSLHLADQGHDVVIVDNMSRRKIDLDLGCDSLTPIQSPEIRLKAWEETGGRPMQFVNMDIAKEYDLLVQLLVQEKPDAVVHFAEQRAAPYSMKGAKEKRYTVENNLGGSNNLLAAIVDSGLDIHVIHLGTMGVYGYGTSGGEIPEGYLKVTLPDGQPKEILHPAYPGSIYHMTKCQDALLFQFYNKNDGLRVTDLHQGIVWGTNTPQTIRDERLINRFDYDGDYGTVLNRFLMQSALGVPLTVYGTGGQTRGFIHIKDTCRCIEAAINNPPKAGDRVEIMNQIAETARVRDIANMIQKQTGCEINYLNNPRKEDAENELEVSNAKFMNFLGDMISLESQEGLFDEVQTVTGRFKERCIKEKILPGSFWNKKTAEACSTNKLEVVKDNVEAGEKKLGGVFM